MSGETAGARRRSIAVLVAAALTLAATCGLLGGIGGPPDAAATDSDLKHSYAFRVEASNGYELIAFAGSQRADGKGELVLFVARHDESVVYQAPATVTATRIDADLGPLGEVALDVAPSGSERVLRPRCPSQLESSKPQRFEPPAFRGRFEFHGEEGFVEAATDAPRDYSEFFVDLLCRGGGGGGGELGGADLPGARLRLFAMHGADRLNLQVNKNRPGARVRLEAESNEVRGELRIERALTVWAPAATFVFGSNLRNAWLEPRGPFSGRAGFHRGAAPGGVWTGNLTVDLPGRSGVPLTGGGVRATLVPSCWQEAEDPSRC